jgi:hypothetical protein
MLAVHLLGAEQIIEGQREALRLRQRSSACGRGRGAVGALSAWATVAVIVMHPYFGCNLNYEAF